MDITRHTGATLCYYVPHKVIGGVYIYHVQEGFGVYSRTKTAVRSLTIDSKHRKIRVNAISPGPIDTPMTRGMVAG